MWWNILKKDFKRNKVTNIILIIFIILATTFMASSISNLKVISHSMANYFEKAGLPDLNIISYYNVSDEKMIYDFLDSNEYVEDWKKDELLILSKENFTNEKGEVIENEYLNIVMPININNSKLFNEKNKEITKVADGEIYLTNKIMGKNDIKVGDNISINLGSYHKSFKVIGNIKDAFYDYYFKESRIFISEKDYKDISMLNKLSRGSIYSVKSSQVDKLKQEFDAIGAKVYYVVDKNGVENTYIIDRALLLVIMGVSIVLILISFTIFYFIINFTINEEYREIGIMKAIGIQESKIRCIYTVKYLAIAILGGMGGLILSFPFENIILENVQRNNVILIDRISFTLNLLVVIGVIVLIVIFAYLSTKKVSRCTPLDAIRRGDTGDRYQNKTLFTLSKSYIKVTWFLALNDISSGLKRYIPLTLIFTLGIIMMIAPINALNTLSNPGVVTLLGLAESDLYLYDKDELPKIIENKSQQNIEAERKFIEDKINDEGIVGKVWIDAYSHYTISFKDKLYNTIVYHGIGNKTDSYNYLDGQSPKYSDEVAITSVTAEKLGAKIGDTIKVKVNEKNKEYLVTAFFQTIEYPGDGIRFSEKEQLEYHSAGVLPTFQISYKDKVGLEEQESRKDKIQSLFPNLKVYTTEEIVPVFIGDFFGRSEDVKQVILLVILSINILVIILSMTTFIVKEKDDIAIMKSIGFDNKAIISWQTLRIGIILVISIILGVTVSTPIAKLTIGKAFNLLGLSQVEFRINPIEVYLIYPSIVFIVTILVGFITALQVKNISSKETNSIE